MIKIKHFIAPEMVFVENNEMKFIYKRPHGLFIKTEYPLWDRYLTDSEIKKLRKELGV